MKLPAVLPDKIQNKNKKRKTTTSCLTRLFKQITREYVFCIVVSASGKLLGEPDLQYYMAVGINQVSRYGMYDFEDYPNQVLSDFHRSTRQLNYVSFKRPPSPLLTQSDDVPEDDFCDANETLAARDECITQYCTCTQMIKVGLGQVRLSILTLREYYHLQGQMSLILI